MRDAFREYFGRKYANAASMFLGLVWVFIAMMALELFRPVQPIFMFAIVFPVVVWMSVTAALHERYKNHPD
jgi:ATP/ADP translocase